MTEQYETITLQNGYHLHTFLKTIEVVDVIGFIRIPEIKTTRCHWVTDCEGKQAHFPIGTLPINLDEAIQKATEIIDAELVGRARYDISWAHQSKEMFGRVI